MENGDCRWPMIAIGVIAIAAAMGGAADSYSDALEAKAAMENGYEQVETESGKIVWQPSKLTQSDDFGLTSDAGE